jgi:peptide/nickel transport system permease protein
MLEFLIRLFREKPLSATGFVIVAVLMLTAVSARGIAPHDYRQQNPREALTAPFDGVFWFGTDHMGRDIFSRIIMGAEVSMIVGFSCVVGFLIIGIIIGMGTGYIGGTLDMVVQRIVDGWMTIPTLILLLALVSVLGQGLWQIILILSVDRGISTSRVLRGEALSLKENVYVEAARAMGAGPFRTFFVHVIPNAFAPMIVMATINLGVFILAEASLSYLGYGVPPPFPSWGSMLSGSSLGYMIQAPWLALWPGIFLTLAVWAFNMLGDGMRDLLDPRLRGSG